MVNSPAEGFQAGQSASELDRSPGTALREDGCHDERRAELAREVANHPHQANPLFITEANVGDNKVERKYEQFLQMTDQLGGPNSLLLGSHCFRSVSKRDAKSVALQMCGLRFFTS